MDGILNVNKPRGQTSYDVVAAIKRGSGERRVGHAGTLDPLATGVLPVLLGKATRVAEFFLDATKVYRARIELGVATDTYDAEGRVTARGDASGVTGEDVARALRGFQGIILQTPPMFSALKQGGKPLYKLARAGVEVARTPRPVRIDEIRLVDWTPPVVTVEVTCGQGTYIRSLAHDLGQTLGPGAHLKELTRTGYGPFHIQDALSLAELETAFRTGFWRRFVGHTDTVLWGWPAVIVGEASLGQLKNGQAIGLKTNGAERCRAYTSAGDFLGVLHTGEGLWRPEKVFLNVVS